MATPLRRYRWGSAAQCMIAIVAVATSLLAGCATVRKGKVADNADAICLFPPSGFSSAGASPPVSLRGRLPATIETNYGIFRRRISSSERAFVERPQFGRELGDLFQLSSYYAMSGRFLHVPRGRHAFVIVVALARHESLPPASCLRSPHYGELEAQQRRRGWEPLYCILEIRGDRIVPVAPCTPFAANEEGGNIFNSYSVHGESLLELTPDDVALVSITTPQGVVRAEVINNVYMFRPPTPTRAVRSRLRELGRQIAHADLPKPLRERSINKYNMVLSDGVRPTRIEWRDAVDRLVRTIGTSDVRQGLHAVGELRSPIEG